VLALCEPPVTAQPADNLRQLVEDHREQAEAGHERLRRDYRALDDRVERLEHDHHALQRKVDRLEQTPVNVDKMAWSTKQLIGIVSAAVLLGGGMWQLDAKVSQAVQESRLNGLKTDDLSKQLTQFLLDNQKK